MLNHNPPLIYPCSHELCLPCQITSLLALRLFSPPVTRASLLSARFVLL